MKPTDDDSQPRQDGWFEHDATWGEVTVGTVIADPSYRSKRWEIIDTAMDTPVEFGRTLWMRAREQSSGEEFTVRPRYKHYAVTILTQDPRDTETAPPTPPSDAEAIMLLVRELGATHLATLDEATGEVTCPDYFGGRTHEGGSKAECEDLMEHLSFAHGVDTSSLARMDFDIRHTEIRRLHTRAHDHRHSAAEAARGGFAHRHAPEDMSVLTGRSR